MTDVVVEDGLVTAVDDAKNEVRFRVDGWHPTSVSPAMERRVDRTLHGSARGLSFRDAAVSIERLDQRRWSVFDDRSGVRELRPGRYLVQVATNLVIYVRFDGPCRLERRSEADALDLDFGGPVAVTIGFRSRIESPLETVTVPRTLEGVRTAIRHQSAAIETATPDRSYPSKRTHPPLVAFGDAEHVPDSVACLTSFDDLTLRVPASLDQLLVVAPLAYYLATDLEFTSAETVSLESPAMGTPLRFDGTEALEAQVASLLHRVFSLDCLVRNAGPYGVDLQESDLLDAMSFDPRATYEATGGERLARYLEVEFAAVADQLPPWHLSVVVEPTYANVPTLPYLLDRLSLIQLPRPVPVSRQAVVSASLGSAFPDRSAPAGPSPSYDLVRNESRLGVHQGWLADGVPVDAFRASARAFENHLGHLEQSDGPRTVVVVNNDDEMFDERTAVTAVYRDRAKELSIDMRTVESVTRDDLAALLAEPIDFLHFIGHCDERGLRCVDGHLSATDLDETGVQTFFLNACGSFEQGLELVDRGSVAGAVTLRPVLDPTATKIGAAFARLVIHGFAIEYALSLASRRSVSNKFYTVVGDGTHRLSQGDDAFPADVTAERRSDHEYAVRFNFSPLNVPGGLAKPLFPDDSAYLLRGSPYTTRLEESVFAEFLSEVNIPVILDGQFCWSTDLADRLRQTENRDPSSTDSKNHRRTNNN